jgi:aspartate dehydrogenase
MKPSKKINIGIIGCGNIGKALARYCSKELKGRVSKVILYDIDREKLARAAEIKNTVPAGRVDDVFRKCSLVVEAAAPFAVRDLLERAVKFGKDVLVMSVGGALGCERLLKKADDAGIKVIMPSGAIAGVDALKAAKIAGLERVTLTTMKPPASLKGVKYLEEKGIDVSELKKETVLFEGNVAAAVKAFPKNINVSAMLAIAGIGPSRTRVRIVTSPFYTRNIHEITIKGKAGIITTRAENVPSPENPGTSYLAVLSAETALAQYFSTIQIG